MPRGATALLWATAAACLAGAADAEAAAGAADLLEASQDLQDRSLHGVKRHNAGVTDAYAVIGARGELQASTAAEVHAAEDLHQQTGEALVRRHSMAALSSRREERLDEVTTTKAKTTKVPNKATTSTRMVTTTARPVAGRKGDPGRPGVAGHKGVVGKAGPPGHPGSRGLPGYKGAAGEAGVKGEVGPKGPTGDPGEKGDKGPDAPVVLMPKGTAKTKALGAVMLLHIIVLAGVFVMLTMKAQELKKKQQAQQSFNNWDDAGQGDAGYDDAGYDDAGYDEHGNAVGADTEEIGEVGGGPDARTAGQ